MPHLPARLRSGAWALGAALALAAAAPARGAPRPPREEALLLEVHLGGLVVCDGLPAYATAQGVRLPLLQLAQALSLDIHALPFPDLAEGFVLDERRTFRLAPGRVTLGDRVEPTDPALLEARDDDVYVALPLLERWLSVKLEVKPELQILEVTALEPLPVQARLEREALAAQLARRGPREPGAARLEDERALVAFPSVDQTLSAEVRHDRPGARTSLRSTTFAAGDLAGAEASLYAGLSNGRDAVDLRPTLARSDPDGRLLGPLAARYAGVGAVLVPGLRNVSSADPRWLGATVTNYPLGLPGAFDRYSLSGALRPGWDVELYQNGALVAYQAARPDGTYAFDELPLLLGQNEYRLVFHGPFGERREEARSLFFGPTMTSPGEVRYRVSAQRDGAGCLRASALLDAGLGRHLSLAGGAAVVPYRLASKGFAFAGLRAALGGLFLQADLDVASDAGRLAELALLTRLGGVNVRLSELLASSFTSELLPARADPLVRRATARLDAVAPAAVPLALALDLQRDTLRSGASEDTVNGRVSATVGRTAFSQTLRWVSLQGFELTEAVTRFSRRFGALAVSGQALWELHPARRLELLDLRVERQLGEVLLQGGVVSLPQSRDERLVLAAVKALGAFGLQVAASLSTTGEVVVGTQLFFSLTREPREGGLVADAQPAAGAGALSARVFLDRNGNGRLDPGEPVIPGARLLVNGSAAGPATDARGVAFLRQLPAYQPVEVAVDEAALEDPQWKAGAGGLTVLARPGKSQLADLPVIPTAVVEGTVSLRERRAQRPLEGAEVLLLDAAGEVAGRARTSYDGWYAFEGVRPGVYRLRLSDATVRELALASPAEREIEALEDGGAGDRALVVTRAAR
ncbi:carboxypeptidase-like regulatory domain-containing protein [Anaeromyxobacter diazotrophicus]|uniref:Carboxypeptidase regulatory-like domain-containing protein n=1 Tax=Anaeromyxobacter diazotrophicus TaxID=2590199 RepID=A0A7I9VLT8_9BACT|nr:carboxypeptidase-like regulatory domain-containing protein [Anaeromyxobacter diazotrophicus]GEJ57361.1 hypothetical protein AMYX_21020 [Anaeromyxobacter diazotrophicus]